MAADIVGTITTDRDMLADTLDFAG